MVSGVMGSINMSIIFVVDVQ